jgi:cardiolipin synthase
LDLIFAPAFPWDGRAVGLWIFHVGLAAAVTLHALLRKRDVPATIAWIGIAWLAPLFGPLLYYGFGINRVRRRARRLKGGARGGARRGEFGGSTHPMDRLAVAVGAITGRETSPGEVVAILNCGDEAYPRMLEAIEGAKIGIRLATYIFRDDELGGRFIEALARAADRGVEIRVLIDGFGGGFLWSSAYHALRRRGVPAARFLHSLLPWKMPFLNMRLHKKSLLVDGEIAFIGGLNIGAENLIAANPKHPVRDVHFQVGGGLIRQIEQEFDDDWSFTTRQKPMRASRIADEEGNASAPARVIVSGPDQEVDKLVLVLLSAIQTARRAIRIITPYFLPDEQLLTALQLASARGVDVDIVVPAVNNQFLVAWALRPHIRPLLDSGVRVWRGPPPFDHSKLMTIDGRWSLIGSANWDMRSLRLNFEQCVEFYGTEIADRLSQIIDSRRHQRITAEEIDGRSMPMKLRDAAARLAFPYI